MCGPTLCCREGCSDGLVRLLPSYYWLPEGLHGACILSPSLRPACYAALQARLLPLLQRLPVLRRCGQLGGHRQELVRPVLHGRRTGGLRQCRRQVRGQAAGALHARLSGAVANLSQDSSMHVPAHKHVSHGSSNISPDPCYQLCNAASWRCREKSPSRSTCCSAASIWTPQVSWGGLIYILVVLGCSLLPMSGSGCASCGQNTQHAF